MPFGFQQKYETATKTMGASLPRPFAPLVKAGAGDDGGTGDGTSGGGGGNLPNGCPKSVGWWWIPLGAIGVMQAAAWLLARK